MKEQSIMLEELNKRGRKGSVSEVAKRAGLHRNTVRRILQGLGGKSEFQNLVFSIATQVIAELEQSELSAKQAIEAQIAKHQQKIKGLRSQVAA